ncbi:DUF4363 domain-containing protein [Nostoc sp. MS1]|uniref:DUF4363 domain-containing protein n=1 Tax=Nostoc sp. MS1 TaxID=2764711 RepID=UPI001CC44A79|nr:DUF4363 domain-containing protein [Nostoc sp. MS1]BCL34688.1 hypothetical protein NSMS1_11350 [Nostoc sp. MS1]
MERFKQILIIAGISLMVLGGCNQAEQPTAQTSPTANSASTSTSNSNAKTDFSGLEGVVNNTQTAVKANNFTKAKDEFGKFEGYWSKVEDGVKAKSPDTYKKIEDSADEINGGLKASKPDKAKVLASLQSLNKDILSVAKP